MPKYMINYPCEVCKGEGKLETINYTKPTTCWDCEGNGYYVTEEFYDCRSDAQADYPDATIKEIKSWGNATISME